MHTQFSTERLDHLGIVAGICRKIGLVEKIDDLIGPTDRHVSVGQATLAMILNGLGFVSRALYLTPEFYRNKPVDILIDPHLVAEDLNDDCLGRALDTLFEAGLTLVFAEIAAHALSVFGLRPEAGHLDTTSFSFQGDFPGDDEECAAIQITHGYSKEKRPDLKQAVVSLICAYQTKIPMWFEVHSGNTSDRSSMPETVDWFIEELSESEAPFVIIADSALYSEESVQRLDAIIDFITRVPATLSQVKRLYDGARIEQMEVCHSDPRYRFQWHESEYGGVEQRWLLVHSEAAAKASRKALESRVKKEQDKATKQIAAHARKSFDCSNDARSSLQSLAKKWKYHQLGEIRVEETKKYRRKGRPSKDDEPILKYSVSADVRLDEEALDSARHRGGFFVLGTNVLDEKRLDAETILSSYKGQNDSVEGGFRFLKDPQFFAHGLYLQKPTRIMAMLMVMSLCLLVYALAEHHLREQLVAHNETVPDQKGKPTQRITLRRLFQIFEGIDVLHLDTGQAKMRQVLNLKDVHSKVLRVLGPECEKCYESPG